MAKNSTFFQVKREVIVERNYRKGVATYKNNLVFLGEKCNQKIDLKYDHHVSPLFCLAIPNISSLNRFHSFIMQQECAC